MPDLFVDVCTITTGGGASVYSQQACLFLPYENREAMTEAGVFDRTRFRCLLPASLTIPPGARFEVVSSGSFAAGVTARMDGEAQKYANPIRPTQVHHIEVTLVEEQH